MSVHDLVHLNAALNTTAAMLLFAGFRAVKRRAFDVHRRFMLSASVTSLLFLVSYVIYHANVGSVKFTATGWIRSVYFAILISHVILAAAIVPLVLMTLVRALRGQLERHRRIARITWPIWMYVSVSGVIVYVLLYQLYPPGV